MMKYATAIRLRTASTEALLRRFTSETTHPAYAAMLEVGRAQRAIFLARWLGDRDLQPETESGLNVVENYNGVNDYIRFGKRGELASNRREEQELGMLCLHILQSSLGLINTLMIQDTLALPEWADVLTDADRRGLSPVFHTNMTPRATPRRRPSRGPALGAGPPSLCASLPLAECPGICKNRAPKCQIVDHAGRAVSLEDLSWTTDRDLRRGGYRADEPLLRRVSTAVVPCVLGRRQIA